MGKAKADAPKKADSRLAPKRKAAEKPIKPAKKVKAGKDPNKPKRPASAFFVFMEEFRKEFKEKNPNNKAVSAVSKAGGERWKSLTESDKAPYVAKAAKRKTEYTKDMTAYNKKLSDGVEKDDAAEEEDESDKSKSEVNDEDEGEESGGEEGEEEDDD